EKYGKIPHREMFNIFNMGIGMVLAVDEADVEKTLEILTEAGEKASVIGKIVEGNGVTIL
ncbi:MAG: phosphoribosylformylglycinamidine cyclo-ligase, partial [Muribaculaceae bacterium]|nr:phosphoribosylformylglycinamidine cyclo-ligase [Muribaculaceae bacterium]